MATRIGRIGNPTQGWLCYGNFDDAKPESYENFSDVWKSPWPGAGGGLLEYQRFYCDPECAWASAPVIKIRFRGFEWEAGKGPDWPEGYPCWYLNSPFDVASPGESVEVKPSEPIEFIFGVQHEIEGLSFDPQNMLSIFAGQEDTITASFNGDNPPDIRIYGTICNGETVDLKIPGFELEGFSLQSGIASEDSDLHGELYFSGEDGFYQATLQFEEPVLIGDSWVREWSSSLLALGEGFLLPTIVSGGGGFQTVIRTYIDESWNPKFVDGSTVAQIGGENLGEFSFEGTNQAVISGLGPDVKTVLDILGKVSTVVDLINDWVLPQDEILVQLPAPPNSPYPGGGYPAFPSGEHTWVDFWLEMLYREFKRNNEVEDQRRTEELYSFERIADALENISERLPIDVIVYDDGVQVDSLRGVVDDDEPQFWDRPSAGKGNPL